MPRTVSFLLLVAGVLVLFFGMQASSSFAAEVQETVEGTRSTRSIVLLTCGAVMAIAGVVGISRSVERGT